MFRYSFAKALNFKNAILSDVTHRLLLKNANFQMIQANFINYRANDLWKSVLSVSNQGSKKGRSSRRGAGKVKDLNIGQNLGDGKLQVLWPGLNTNVFSENKIQGIKIQGEDKDREKKLVEIRNKMDKFRTITIPPHERGFTGSSLNGKSIGAPISYDDVDFTGFDTRILMYKSMLAMKSILGKKKTISCFVVTGNHDGIVGYGTGKGSSVSAAIKLAKAHASQRLLKIDLYENRTLFHDFYEEYYYTKIYAEKKPKGYGLICHRALKTICKLIGIKDINIKVEGSRNHINLTKAFLSGLLNQKKYADIAKERNMYVVEFKPELKNIPSVLAAPTHLDTKKDEDRFNNSNLADEDPRDLNLYLFDNKYRREKKKKLPFYFNYPSYKQYCKLRDKNKDLKKARLERIKLLPEEILLMSKYPLRMKPKKEITE